MYSVKEKILPVREEFEATKPLEVKIFMDRDPEVVSENLNLWMESNPVRIHHIGQSQSEKNGKFVFIISVFFTLQD
jgi:hypothetical protein